MSRSVASGTKQGHAFLKTARGSLKKSKKYKSRFHMLHRLKNSSPFYYRKTGEFSEIIVFLNCCLMSAIIGKFGTWKTPGHNQQRRNY
jgi:hypothetical protein